MKRTLNTMHSTSFLAILKEPFLPLSPTLTSHTCAAAAIHDCEGAARETYAHDDAIHIPPGSTRGDPLSTTAPHTTPRKFCCARHTGL